MQPIPSKHNILLINLLLYLINASQASVIMVNRNEEFEHRHHRMQVNDDGGYDLGLAKKTCNGYRIVHGNSTQHTRDDLETHSSQL